MDQSPEQIGVPESSNAIESPPKKQEGKGHLVFKRKNVKAWWYKFYWTVKQTDGTKETFLVRRSARTQNRRAALQVAEEHKRALRLGDVHPLDPWPKTPAPLQPEVTTLRQFSLRFLEHNSVHVKSSTARIYEICTNRLLQYHDLAAAPLNKINPELISRYIKHRKASNGAVSTLNGDLRTLRRMLRLAYEWEEIARAPIVHELPGEKGRERVLTFEEERRYLAVAGENFETATILAVDTGMRPNSELFCLEWESVCLDPSALAPCGHVRVKAGKTDNAVRVIPLTPRAQEALLRQKAKKLHPRWVFPGSGNSGHVVSMQGPHLRALRKTGLEPFPFYAWRHTFGTRCAESGMDRFTLAKLMGHSSPRVTERYYVHITEPHVSLGFEKFVQYQTQRLPQASPETIQ